MISGDGFLARCLSPEPLRRSGCPLWTFRRARIFVIKVELPGVDEKDVGVSISENTLTIKGEKKKEEEEKGEHYYSCERCYGAFQRSFQLPTNVQGDKVEAAFDKGVLKMTIPKAEEAKKKEIQIKVKPSK